MKPTVLTISGSPRKDGDSAGLLLRFSAGLHADFVHYDAYDCAFAPCTDCRYCRIAEGCAIDDMDAFFGDFENCCGIVIASPVYNLSFPAPLKVILDRMQRYYSARFYLGKCPPIPRKRPVAVLLSAGSPREDGKIILRQLHQAFSVTNCEVVCSIIHNGTDSPGAEPCSDTQIRSASAQFAASAGIFTCSSHNS